MPERSFSIHKVLIPVVCWVLGGWVIGYASLTHTPDLVGTRYSLSSLLRSTPLLLARGETLVLFGILLGAAYVSARFGRRGKVTGLPVGPTIPILLALPILICFQTFLPDGTLRNLLYVYPEAIAGSLSTALALAPLLQRIAAPRWLILTALGLAVVAYGLLWSHWTVHRHYVFRSAAWDLGYTESALWNTTQGRLFQTAIQRPVGIDLNEKQPCLNVLGEHFTPISILVLPLYVLGGRTPQFLLILQSFWLATGAIPLFLLARHRWQDSLSAFVFAIAFLFYPALHVINTFDFHCLALAIPFMFWSFYYLEKGVSFNFFLFLFLAALCKEEISLVAVSWGVYIAISKRHPIGGAIVSFFCAVIFIFAVKVWMPFFSGDEGFWPLVRYKDLGSGFSEAADALISRPMDVLRVALAEPKKIQFLLRLLVPLLFVVVASPGSWLLAIPALSICLLSSEESTWSMADHHVTSPAIALWPAAVLGVYRISRVLSRWSWRASVPRTLAPAILVCCIWTARIQWESSVYGRIQDLRLPVTAHVEAGHRLIRMIPADASVEASNHLIPHLCHRREVWLYDQSRGTADYVLLDLSPHEGKGRYTYPLSETDFIKKVRSLLSEHRYGLVAYEKGFLLLSKDSKNYDFEGILACS
jgi:uncharacterized membrane protein